MRCEKITLVTASFGAGGGGHEPRSAGGLASRSWKRRETGSPCRRFQGEGSPANSWTLARGDLFHVSVLQTHKVINVLLKPLGFRSFVTTAATRKPTQMSTGLMGEAIPDWVAMASWSPVLKVARLHPSWVKTFMSGSGFYAE